MKPTRPYVVWRRGDGYVGATVGPPHSGGTEAINTFEVLLETHDWSEARALIKQERNSSEYANPERSWR